MSDRSLRLEEIRDELQAYFARYGHGWKPLQLFHEWARLCGHFQTVDSLQRFTEFVEGGDGPA